MPNHERHAVISTATSRKPIIVRKAKVSLHLGRILKSNFEHSIHALQVLVEYRHDAGELLLSKFDGGSPLFFRDLEEGNTAGRGVHRPVASSAAC